MAMCRTPWRHLLFISSIDKCSPPSASNVYELAVHKGSGGTTLFLRIMFVLGSSCLMPWLHSLVLMQQEVCVSSFWLLWNFHNQCSLTVLAVITIPFVFYLLLAVPLTTALLHKWKLSHISMFYYCDVRYRIVECLIALLWVVLLLTRSSCPGPRLAWLQLQGWGIHSFSGKPVPVLDHPPSKKFPFNI